MYGCVNFSLLCEGRVPVLPQIILLCILLLPVTCFATEAAPGDDRRPAVIRGDLNYENITITEDATWRGTILVRGSVVIAPQATLRIEPGTIVRFMKSAIIRQTPRLVIMGRLHCNGTIEKPVLFTSNSAAISKGDWGGLLFLSSEKRNQLDNFRIEGADIAIDSHFSTLTIKGASIAKCSYGLVLRDSIATLSAIAVNGCITGIESRDSEIDMKDAAISDNKKGVDAYHSTLVLSSVKISTSSKEGLLAEDCRIRFASCEFAGNGLGAFIKGGEGQVQLSRFVRNSDVGLLLSGARIKLQRCTFTDNRGDGMKVDDGRSSVWYSIFSGNSGYNLANSGRDDFSAVQNWWGGIDESAIMAKLLGSSKDARLGAVIVAPWLTEKPVVSP